MTNFIKTTVKSANGYGTEVVFDVVDLVME